ncbi:hypothetical protein HK100_003465 [Physocladia obscura]|uniref:Major facilitator superfamily (MFS) profile domain-containing protein n=1 Tax=Physocladia obscura TaxID=109957 RepID=A0AAD5X9D4_9FUNG|nr:hypothetical protein HK100_003465 [Physocladia obscura]
MEPLAKNEETIPDDTNTSGANDLDKISIPLSKLQFVLVIAAVNAAFMLSALDGTIVSTAVPSIVLEFGNQDRASWIGSAFLLSGAASDILWGRLAQVFGRRWPFLTSLLLFAVGSVFCAASTSMDMLIIARFVTGLGSGGIFCLSTIIISDVVSLRDRGSYQGTLGITFGIASILGPVLGGAFSDNLSWRWCFWINIPIVVFSSLVFLFCNIPSPNELLLSKFKKIDKIGAVLVFATTIILLLPIECGGNVWAWNSSPVIICFILSPILIIITVWWQTKAEYPLIPADLFADSSVLPLLLMTIFFAAIFFAGIFYVTQFFQVVNNMTATKAGLQQFPNIISSVITTILSGIYCTKFLSYLPFIYIGPIFMITGSVLISTFQINTPLAHQIGYLFIFGIGTGSILQVRILGVQASVQSAQVATVTAVSNACNALGGTLGIAIVGSIFTNKFTQLVSTNSNLAVFVAQAKNNLGLDLDLTQPLQTVEILKALPNQTAQIVDAIEDVKDAFVGAFRISFLSMVPMAGVILMCAFFIRDNMKLKHEKYEERVAEEVLVELVIAS